MVAIALGVAALFALAIYGILTGKSSGPQCSCGTGACGRPVDDPRKDEHADTEERLSAEHPPSDEELAREAEGDRKRDSGP
jgi:hypothetical protein